MKNQSKLAILTTLILALLTAPLYAVPISDKVMQQLIDEGRFDQFLKNMADAHVRGVDQPEFLPGKGNLSTALAPTTTFKVLVILVDFPDKPYTSGWAAGTAADFDSLLFSTGKNPTGSMKEFYIENSYGSFVLQGDVVGWYRASQNYSYYTNNCDGTDGMGTYPHNAQKLVEEAVDSADANVDFSQYDNNHDGYVDGIFVIHAGTGYEETGNDCEIHSHQWNISSRLKDGVYVSTYSIEPEESPTSQKLNSIGVFCHEFGHVLGLPDLYDTNYNSEGCGRWDLMASGSYNGSSKTPSHFGAWCKKRLGWLTPTNITANQTNVSIPAVETSPTVYRLWRHGLSGNEFYLVENRQKTGSDVGLPASGLLIWHVDEGVNGNNTIWHPEVMLEQADGRFDLQNNSNTGDGSDPFPNGGAAPNFTDKTTPSSKAYASTSTEVAVWNISSSASTMTADFDVYWSRPYFRLSTYAFSDAAHGDGDGIYEAGETIELTCTIADDWKVATDASISLSIDDATLNLTNGSVSLGTIASGGSANNSSNPLEFSIPVSYVPRVDSFFLTVSSDAGSFVTTLAVEKKIGKPIVLLVDDDNNAAYDTFFVNSMNSRRTPWDTWVKYSSGSPSASTLSGYSVVSWMTGAYRASPLTTSDVTAMTGYLDGGGKLFLSGQGIAQQLSTLNPTFLSNYLHANYLGNTLVPIAIPDPAGIVFQGLDTLALQGTGSASDVTKPDHLSAVNGGVQEVRYIIISTDGAAVSYAGTYRTVYLGFGFETFAKGDPRWESRDTVLDRVLTYFGLPMSPGYPAISGINIGPGAVLNLVGHTPTISWGYYDSGSNPQQKYQIQVGTDSDWSTAEMWDSGPTSSTDTSVAYAGSALVDGRTYFYRVRVYNGIQWSPWRLSSFRMNSKPGTPTGLSPNNLAGLGTATPILHSLVTTDPDADGLTYSYQVCDDSLMTHVVASADNVTSSGTTASWTVSPALADEGIYYWQIRAFDGYEYGSWSSRASFWVNSVNTVPIAFSLIAPADQAFLTANPVFVWAKSTDSDRYDSVKYALYYSTDSTFATKDSVIGIFDTQFTLTGTLAAGNTYWKVVARDLFGGTTASTVFRFSFGVPGDANSDGSVNVGDPVFLINYIFKGGAAPASRATADANHDCKVNVGDAVFLINYIFKSGAAPTMGCK